MGSPSLAAARQAARPPGPWRQYPSSPEGWGVKMCFRLGSFTEWWWQTTKCHCEKKSILWELIYWKTVATPQLSESRCVGPQNLEATLEVEPCLVSSGLYPGMSEGLGVSLKLEDCRMMRIVCIARRWKQRVFFFFFSFFFYNFHFVYIQTIIHLFIFIIITISSISVNMWQNSSGCCCLWSG